MKNTLNAFLQDEQGQDLVEYALLLAFVSLACVTVLGTVGGSIKSVFNAISTKMGVAATNAAAGN